MSLRSSSTPVKAINCLGNDTNDMIPRQLFKSLTRVETHLYDDVNPIVLSTTSLLASTPPYEDILEEINVFASPNKEKLKSEQINTLKYSPSDYNELLQRQKIKMIKLLNELGSEAIVDLPDVRAQVSDNLGSTRSYNALFDMVLRAKSHGAFYQFKGKSLTSFTLFISDCMTAIRQLAITDDEIPILDRIAGRYIDYLIPRDSKIAHARHIAVEKKSDITKEHKQYDFTLSEILNDIKMVLESQGMNRLEQFNARPPMKNAMDASTFAKKFKDYLRRRFATNHSSEFLKDKPDLRREKFYLFTRGLHPILRENNFTKNLYELQYDEFIATYKNNNKHINKNSNVSKNKQSNLKFDNTKKPFPSSGSNNSKGHQSRYSSVKPANKPTTSYKSTSSGMNYKSQNNQSSSYNKNSIKTKPQKHGKIHTIEPTHEEYHDDGEMNVIMHSIKEIKNLINDFKLNTLTICMLMICMLIPLGGCQPLGICRFAPSEFSRLYLQNNYDAKKAKHVTLVVVDIKCVALDVFASGYRLGNVFIDSDNNVEHYFDNKAPTFSCAGSQLVHLAGRNETFAEEVSIGTHNADTSLKNIRAKHAMYEAGCDKPSSVSQAVPMDSHPSKLTTTTKAPIKMLTERPRTIQVASSNKNITNSKNKVPTDTGTFPKTVKSNSNAVLDGSAVVNSMVSSTTSGYQKIQSSRDECEKKLKEAQELLVQHSGTIQNLREKLDRMKREKNNLSNLLRDNEAHHQETLRKITEASKSSLSEDIKIASTVFAYEQRILEECEQFYANTINHLKDDLSKCKKSISNLQSDKNLVEFEKDTINTAFKAFTNQLARLENPDIENDEVQSHASTDNALELHSCINKEAQCHLQLIQLTRCESEIALIKSRVSSSSSLNSIPSADTKSEKGLSMIEWAKKIYQLHVDEAITEMPNSIASALTLITAILVKYGFTKTVDTLRKRYGSSSNNEIPYTHQLRTISEARPLSGNPIRVSRYGVIQNIRSSDTTVKLPVISFNIGTNKFNALVDTGASLNVISQDAFGLIPSLHKTMVKPSLKAATVANNDKLVFRRASRLYVEANNK
uniref:Reverse transcriptase domain-containing protein n=1 Tax=Strongyloides venezuelensis TaxID=75913 RepID=A0A0K0FBD8_STRVS